MKHLWALDKPHHLQAAMSWDFQVRRFERFLATHDRAVHTLTFESLCTDPLETIADVCRFLKVPMTDECRRYLERRINPAKVAQYRENPPQQVAEAQAVMSRTLARLGYRPREAA